jgi:ornithine cyclodeaminase/alanine dehydrogenase-like protein (mu-crystallin family)
MLIINKQLVQQLANPAGLMEALEEALIDLEERTVIMPQRMHADFDENVLLLMPCYSGDFFVTKMVSVFYGDRIFTSNISRGTSRSFAIVPVSKLVTGKVELSVSKTTAFKSVGMALFDLAAAKYFYQKALKKNSGTFVNFTD